MMLGLVDVNSAKDSRKIHGSGYSRNRNNNNLGLHSQGRHNILAHSVIHTKKREPHQGVPFFITTGGGRNAWRIQGKITNIPIEEPYDIENPAQQNGHSFLIKKNGLLKREFHSLRELYHSTSL